MANLSINYWRKTSLFFLFSIYVATLVIAQPESESPYSDQAFDPGAEVWYESPLAWMGLIVLLGGVFLYLRRQGRRRS